MATKTTGYSVEQVIEVVEMLSHSQGFYGRLLKDIEYMKENEPEKFEDFKFIVELMGLKTPFEVFEFFEG